MRRLLLSLGGAAALALSSVPAAGAQAAAPGSAERSLRSALAHGLGEIGGATGAYVVDLNTGQTLFAHDASTGRLPASVEKIYTTSTALLRFGPDATLTTSVLGSGTISASGAWSGTLYLKGGGDPTFGSAGFDQAQYGGQGATIQRLVSTLVRRTGISSVSGSVIGDESYFDSLRGTSVSSFQFDPDLTGALSALAFNRGLTTGGTGYIPHPASFAARQLVLALRGAHVHVPSTVAARAGVAPATARLLATVHSPRIATLVQMTNTPSDNYFAETLLKDLGARFGGGGTTADGAAVVRSELAQSFGIHPKLVDGSGLSRDDSTSPQDVVAVLSRMQGNPAFWNSLAIGGQTGTLQYEMQGTAAQGNCRGKTGTLHDVASLVGYCHARDGHMLVFAFLANGLTNPDYAHQVEGDQMAPALAKYDG